MASISARLSSDCVPCFKSSSARSNTALVSCGRTGAATPALVALPSSSPGTPPLEFRQSQAEQPAAGKNRRADDKEREDPANSCQPKDLDALIANISEKIAHGVSRLFICTHGLIQKV